MQIEAILPLFVNVCHMIHAKGLVSGSGGNLSARYGSQFLITPSGRSLQMLKAEDIIVLSEDGSFQSKNGGVPSKEWRMHLACYKRKEVGAVIHVHSVYAVAASCLRDLNQACALPVYTPGYALRVGKLTAVPYLTPGSQELSDAVSAIITRRDSVMMANHGILGLGCSIESALNLIEEIEENAKMHFLLAGQGKPLTEEEQKILRTSAYA